MTQPGLWDSGPFTVAHLAYTSFPADTRVKREALAVASTGERVAVVCLREPNQPPEEDIGPLHVVRLRGRRSRGGPLVYLTEYGAFIWRCRRLLSTDPRFRQLKVVHVHTLPDFLIWAAIPAQRRGARVVLDLHEIFPEFTAAKYRGPIGRLLARGARAIELAARRIADVTITVNVPIAELLASRGIGRSERVAVVHNSPDTSDFGVMSPSAIRRGGGCLELVYHGTLTRLYGLDTAIHGVALAAQAGLRVHLTILGEGPERTALQRLAARIGNGLLVSFEAHIPQSALRDRLRQADGGVVPTRLDGMTAFSLSTKLLEYVHLGIPVLPTRLPTYVRYLGTRGVWYWEPGESADFARVIALFAKSSAEEREAGVTATQRALASIAWSRERERLLEVYRDLLTRDEGPRG
jgi:glycosyltransferase involved in cell wall biosynthesis